MRIEKVVLINLPSEGQCADRHTPLYVSDEFAAYPPLGLLYVATAIKDDYPTEVLDLATMQLSIEQSFEAIVAKQPSVLGISCETYRLYAMVELIRLVKARLPQVVIVVGGPHTTLYPQETLGLPGVDFVIAGDGEVPMKSLLDVLQFDSKDAYASIPGLIYRDADGTLCQNPVSQSSIDSSHMPDWDLLDYHRYYTAADASEQTVTMISSRGCPLRCTFCDVQGKTYRYREPKDVVDEMEFISRKFSNPVIHIFDDTFNILKDRVMEICAEIERRQLKIKWTTRARVFPFDEAMAKALKRAGLVRIHFGVESGSVLTLKKIRKGVKREQIIKAFQLCRQYKIDTLSYFMIGFDWETPRDISDTVSFTREIDSDYILANILHPAAKTQIYDDMIRSGQFTRDHWQDYVTNPTRDFCLPEFRHPVWESYLRRKLDEIYLLFYLSPKFVFNNIMRTGDEAAHTGRTKFSLRNILFKTRLATLILISYVGNLAREMMVRMRYFGHRPCGPTSQIELPIVDATGPARVEVKLSLNQRAQSPP